MAEKIFGDEILVLKWSRNSQTTDLGLNIKIKSEQYIINQYTSSDPYYLPLTWMYEDTF
jgi:hypothetical protein